MCCRLSDRRWNGFGKADVKAVITATHPVHVHLLMHPHMNAAMIRDS